MKDDIAEYNRRAWDQQVSSGNRWTIPVTPDAIRSARKGQWDIVLTPEKPVPKSWFPGIGESNELSGLDVLCLACGGGQQAPILAAVGANVTVLDNSPAQLNQDQFVAKRDGLKIRSVLGDMRDLSDFDCDCFDAVFNPCSVTFVPEVQSVFQEVHRVLRPGGSLMCGFINPVRFLFDENQLEEGSHVVRHKLPYSDETHLEPAEIKQLRESNEPAIFSHSLEQLIAGQTKAGLSVCGFYEDRCESESLSAFLPVYFATLAKKNVD